MAINYPPITRTREFTTENDAYLADSRRSNSVRTTGPDNSGVGSRSILVGDPLFNKVVILCHCDFLSGGLAALNNAPLGGGITSSALGTVGTSGALFNKCFNGGNAERLTASDVAVYQIGTGDFCMEFAYFTSVPNQTNRTLLDYGKAVTNPTTGFEIYITSSQFRFFTQSADKISGGTVATNTWQRIRVERTSGTTRMFIDGVKVGSDYVDGNTYAHNEINLGSESGGTGGGSGTNNFDEWRFTIASRNSNPGYTIINNPFPDSQG